MFLFSTFVILASTLISCRKEEARDLRDGRLLTFLPLHSHNGFNGGAEEAVDRGGICPACTEVIVSCSATKNVVKIGATNFNMTSTRNVVNEAKVI